MPDGFLAPRAGLAAEDNRMDVSSKACQAGTGEKTDDKPQPELVWIRYRCDVEHRNRVKRLCQRRGIDQSTLVRMLMKKAIDREELEEFAYRNLYKP
jgi:hypothetical protein